MASVDAVSFGYKFEVIFMLKSMNETSGAHPLILNGRIFLCDQDGLRH
jgi:hypothetical protein